jgi:hypothetical protein
VVAARVTGPTLAASLAKAATAGSSSFLKKRTKKLLLLLSRGHVIYPGVNRNRQKFFGSFFQKRTASLP